MNTKELFLEYAETRKPSMRANLLATLKSVLTYEQAHGTHLLEMGRQEFIDFVNSKGFSDPVSARGFIDPLSSFYKWVNCAKNMQLQNIPQSVSPKELDYITPIKASLSPNYKQICDMIAPFFQPSDGYELYPISAFAWLGIPLQDAVVLPADNVDITAGTVLYHGETLHMVPMMREILAEYAAVSTSTRQRGQLETWSADRIGYFIYRMCPENAVNRGKPFSVQQASATVWRLQTRFLESGADGIQLSYVNVMKSGSLHRVLELELQGVDVHSTKNMEIVKACFPTAKTKTLSDIMLMYDAYKKAFHFLSV